MATNASEDCLIQINGGMVTVDAGGDGLDSNGYVEVNGGVSSCEWLGRRRR